MISHSITLVFIIISFFLYSSVFSDTFPKIEKPGFMTLSNVGEEPLGFGGLKVDSYLFQSSKGNKDIVKFYKKLWEGQIKSVETPGWIYHTNFNGKYLTTVQVKKTKKSGMGAYGGGSVKVGGLISISEPGAIKDKSKKIKVEIFYPITPGTQKVSDLSTVDMGKKSRTTVYDSPGSVSSNLNHYKLHFEAKGWQEAHSNLAAKMVKKFGGASLIMQKGSDELVLSFIPDRRGRTKVVGVFVDK